MHIEFVEGVLYLRRKNGEKECASSLQWIRRNTHSCTTKVVTIKPSLECTFRPFIECPLWCKRCKTDDSNISDLVMVSGLCSTHLVHISSATVHHFYN